MGLRTVLGLRKKQASTSISEPSAQADRTCFRIAEEHAERRRIFVRRFAPKGCIGAELGVFTGAFSKIIFKEAKPKKLYLVDVWHTKFGERFPWASAFTDFGMLTTREALDRVTSIAAALDGNVEIVVSDARSWLESLAPSSLDWVYLDTSHIYDDTLAELTAASRAVKPSGLILGDDAVSNPAAKHHGVFRAIRDFTRQQDYEITYLDDAYQWIIRRSA